MDYLCVSATALQLSRPAALRAAAGWQWQLRETLSPFPVNYQHVWPPLPEISLSCQACGLWPATSSGPGSGLVSSYFPPFTESELSKSDLVQ